MKYQLWDLKGNPVGGLGKIRDRFVREIPSTVIISEAPEAEATRVFSHRGAVDDVHHYYEVTTLVA